MRRSVLPVVLVFAVVFFLGLTAAQAPKAGDAALGTRKYADYQTPQFCGTACHTDIYRQWQQAMMSQAYTHHWDPLQPALTPATTLSFSAWGTASLKYSISSQ